jgi:hypothetical protein
LSLAKIKKEMAKTSAQIRREKRLKKREIVITDYTVCHYCKSTGLNEADNFCPNCRFPQRGTQAEMGKFMGQIVLKKSALDDQKKAIKKARNILYILAGINLLYGLILGLIVNFDAAILIGSIIGAGIYLALGIWSKKKPFAAILSGFFVYIVFNVMGAIADPHTIYQGIIWKVVIISGFIYGYKGVKDSENIEKELTTIKESKDLAVADEVS